MKALKITVVVSLDVDIVDYPGTKTLEDVAAMVYKQLQNGTVDMELLMDNGYDLTVEPMPEDGSPTTKQEGADDAKV